MKEKILNRYKEEFSKIERAIKENLKSQVKLAEDIGEHILLAEGKRLRPLLFVLSARIFGCEDESIYNLSTVFEYIHAASLLHDDVLDNADRRRKRPSVNSLWGNHAAVLGGDFLYSTSFIIAVRYGNQRFLKLLTDTTKIMAEGQIMELINTNNTEISKEQYLNIIKAKTAALISASCSGGGIIGGAEDGIVESLSGFGFNMGVAFQIMDDLLDYTSSSSDMGKPVGKDLKEGKITLPLIYAFSQLPDKESYEIKEKIRKGKIEEKDFGELVDYIRNTKSIIDRVKDDIFFYTGRARDYLEEIPQHPAKMELFKLNEFISKRTS